MVGVAVGVVTNLFIGRLCEAKQSKVYIPEHPFPHAEVCVAIVTISITMVTVCAVY